MLFRSAARSTASPVTSQMSIAFCGTGIGMIKSQTVDRHLRERFRDALIEGQWQEPSPGSASAWTRTLPITRNEMGKIVTSP